MKYIGIRGHSGAGKESISYLLGNTINYLKTEKEVKWDFDGLYKEWCQDMMEDESSIYKTELEYIYFEHFSDALMVSIAMLLGCDTTDIQMDYNKDHMIINLRDFSHKIYDKIPEDIHLWGASEYFDNCNGQPATAITSNTFMVLREFIMYYGQEVMQRFFGLNVWVKTLNASKDLFTNIFDEDDMYKIFCDVKTPSEVTYIKNQGGLIIKVVRPKTPKNGRDRLAGDPRVDFVIEVSSDLYSTKECVLNIAQTIIKNDQHE